MNVIGNESPEPVDAKSKSPMLHRMQGFDGACDLLPLPAGPFHLEDPKVTGEFVFAIVPKCQRQ